MGVEVRAEGTAGEGDQRRPAAVAAAARGKRRGRRRRWQQANWGGVLGVREARGMVGRWRARVGARAQGGGGNGGRRGADGARRGERPGFIGGLGFVGDGGVTVKMPPWSSPSVAARTVAMPLSDRRSVPCARVGRGRDGVWRLGGLPGLGACACMGKGRLGWWASGGLQAQTPRCGRRRPATRGACGRATSRRAGALP
jgi:hypothetical protein